MLRKEIDDLRVERRRFDDLYKKVDEQQEQLKQEIGQIVEQSTQAYEQRLNNKFCIFHFEGKVIKN